MLPLRNHAPDLFFLLANLKLCYWHYIYLIPVLLSIVRLSFIFAASRRVYGVCRHDTVAGKRRTWF